MARTPSPGTDEDAADATPEVTGADQAPPDPETALLDDADAPDAASTSGASDVAAAPASDAAGTTRRGPRHARRRARRRRWPYGVAAVVALLVAGALVQLLRPVPAVSAELLVPARLVVAGPAPAIPWPTSGQGAVAIPALGLLRTSAAETPVPVASLTKIMTAYVVLRAHPLAAGDEGPVVTMTAADEAHADAQRQAGDASVPVKAGEQLTERQLLDGLLVPSADNLADVLATWVAGSTAAFVATMNTTAAALGLRDTHYADASGLDPGSVSTAADQLRLAMTAMQVPAFAAVVDQPKTTLPVAGTVSSYVRSIGVDGVVGVKSGYTDAAKGCLVLAATRSVGGRQVLVFAAVTGQTGADPHAAADAAARAVLDPAGAAIVPLTLSRAGVASAAARAPWGALSPMRSSRAVALLAWPGDVVHVSVSRPVGTGGARSHATLVVRDGDERISVPIVTDHPIGGPSILWRLLHG